MFDRRKGLDRLPADAPCRRVRIGEFGELFLQLPQLPQPPVELRVGDLDAILHVIEALVAPEVVAKGVDLVAASIRKAAEEASVPVLQNPVLARALYREVAIGQMITDEFFAAVAEVLAFVFRHAGRRRRAA